MPDFYNPPPLDADSVSRVPVASGNAASFSLLKKYCKFVTCKFGQAVQDRFRYHTANSLAVEKGEQFWVEAPHSRSCTAALCWQERYGSFQLT